MPTFFKSSVFVGLVMLFSTPGRIQAQTEPPARKSAALACAIKTVAGDVKYVVTSPLHMTSKGRLHFVALTAVAAGFVLRADDKIDEELALEGYEFSARPFTEFAKLGKVYDDLGPVNTALGVTAASLAGGLILHDQKLLQTSRLLFESSALTFLFTTCSKGILGRARPYTDHGPRDFSFLKFSSTEDFKSMPSGHVSSAFALMTVIAKQYDHWYVEIPAYAFATSVAFQRMTSRSHWASDTILGGALGYWVSSMLVRKQRQAPQLCSVQPYILAERLGVVVSF